MPLSFLITCNKQNLGSTRKYCVYEIVFYWKDEEGIKSFYKIGYTSIGIEARFGDEIRNGLKIFVLNLIEDKLYKEATTIEEGLLKLAKASNKVEFEQYEDPEIGIGNWGDFHDYKFPYFSGATEVFKTPLRFSGLLRKLNEHWSKNPPIYYPRKYNTTLLEKIDFEQKTETSQK